MPDLPWTTIIPEKCTMTPRCRVCCIAARLRNLAGTDRVIARESESGIHIGFAVFSKWGTRTLVTALLPICENHDNEVVEILVKHYREQVAGLENPKHMVVFHGGPRNGESVTWERDPGSGIDVLALVPPHPNCSVTRICYTRCEVHYSAGVLTHHFRSPDHDGKPPEDPRCN